MRGTSPESPETISYPEQLKTLNGKILLLPDIEGERNFFAADVLRLRYRPEEAERIFRANLERIKKVRPPAGEQSLWPQMVAYWNDRGERGLRILRELKRKRPQEAIPDVRDTLAENFGGIPLSRKSAITYDRLQESLGEELAASKEQVVTVSSSHTTTVAEIEAAVQNREAEGDIAVGIITFDTHIDTFKVPPRIVCKASVFWNLFSDNDSRVQRVAIIGPPAGVIREVRGAGSRCLPPEVMERTEIVGEKEYTQEGKVDQERLNQRVDKIVRDWKEAGITNIVFSVDADVLRMWRMGYTAPEYNPLAALTFLVSKDLRNLSDDALYYKLMGWLGGGSRFNPIAGNPERLGSVGLSLGELGKTIDRVAEAANKAGIEVGIKLAAGGRFIGDVVEAGWPDYKRRTARAVGPLAVRMLKAAVQAR